MNDLAVQKLPRRILGLSELSFNLWWSWHPEARNLFKALDRFLWKATCHNPVKLLNQIDPHRLVAAAADTKFLQRYDAVMKEFRDCSSHAYPEFQTEHPQLSQNTVAYFSMEFAIHSSLPLYAGGLGVLAGDYCKEASDMGLPLIGVGFMYPQGYFQQRITEDGWQEEIYRQIDFADSPITRVFNNQRQPLKVRVDLDSRAVYVNTWQVQVGRVKLYLIDTNLEENSPDDRQLSARLYGGNSEMRLQQEIILGVGGVRILRELGINPAIWHANEGHAAIMMLERCRELVAGGLDFSLAFRQVQQTTVFTTHTPVPAGNDVFPHSLIEKYFNRYWCNLGLDHDRFLKLGTKNPEENGFNMTVLGLRAAQYRNGVSQLHRTVCHRMWQVLWPDLEEQEVPISSITNGIHIPTWISPPMAGLYSKYLGSDWLDRQDDPSCWELIDSIPDREIWEARRWLKSKLTGTLQNRGRERWSQGGGSPAKALAMGALLDPEALTLGFCRRFTDYKRPWLILKDINRLKQILQGSLRPVQIVFSGKAHPNDHRGKCLIQEVHNIARDPAFGGRVVFVEDYDLHLSRYLVQGVDLWLNTPRRCQEASGTSGMKSALNGIPHFSVLDGWWYEGYNGLNGWAIQDRKPDSDSADQDISDADGLYNILENVIVPLYYERDMDGVPHGWIRVVKEAIRSCAPVFSTRRMLKEYIEQMYLPALSLNPDRERSAATKPGTASLSPV